MTVKIRGNQFSLPNHRRNWAGQFSNAKFLEECAVSCPFWTDSLKGANGVKRKSSS